MRVNAGRTNAAGAANAALSNRLPWNRLDAVPQEISDQILWSTVHGTASTPPPGPNASPDEHDRAVAVRALLRANRDLRGTSSRGSDG
jgi:hypothetical protein